MRSWKWIRRAGGLLVGSTAIIGVMHMPVFRSVLMRVGGCPVTRVTPEQVEQAQTRALRTLRGAEPAPDRPALGFSFTATTIDHVRAWARDHHVACEVSRKDSLLKCDAVPASALNPGADGTFDEVAFGFRLADHRLVNVTTLSTGLTAREASARFTATAGRLSGTLGAPPLHRLPAGDWDPHAPVYVTYRYSNYIAELTGMELPGRGVVLREHYVAIT
jgi:hypothetical protein